MGLASITNNILTDTGVSPSGLISGSGSAGIIAYWTGVSTQSFANQLYWDNSLSRLGVNVPIPTERLHISGNFKLDSGVITLNNSVNAVRGITITNTLAGSTAQSRIDLVSDTSSGSAGLLKVSSSYGGYKFIVASDYSFYNASAGDIAVQNDWASGNIKFGAGGSSTAQMTLHSSGNLLLGSTTNGVGRLQVTGDTLLKGSGNTNTTTALTVQNSDGTNMWRFLNDGRVNIGSAGVILYPADNINQSGALTIGGTGLQFAFAKSTQEGYGLYIRSTSAAQRTNTTGDAGIIDMFHGFAPTSGNGTFVMIKATGAINQTGGANGITRGLYVNPTLTSAADWRSIEWSNNAGWGLYGAGTAPNLINGNLIIGPSALNQAGAESSLHVGRAMNTQASYGATIRYEAQSGVLAAHGLNITLSTQDAAFTISNIYGVTILGTLKGASNTITNQYGVFVNSAFVGATNNYAYYSDIPAGANRWNLYMNGTADNYIAGALGIGSTALTGYNFRNSKSITGSSNSIANGSDGQIQTTVSVSASYYRTQSNQIVGTSTTSIFHYSATQGTLSGISNNQYGFHVDSTLIGSTNNYGFYGNIAAATGRWNLYMNGTAANYLNGSLLIGSATNDNVNKLQVTGSSAFNGVAYVNTNAAIAGYGHSLQVLANASGGMIVSTTNTASGIGIVNSSSSNKTWDISPFNNNLAINESGSGSRMYFLSGGNITVGGITNSGNLFEILGTFKTTGVNTLSNLQGTGSRMVVADANGVLSTQAIPGGSLSGSGVAGQVTFWTGASTLGGSNNLFWDATNSALGVGTNTPTVGFKLHVNGPALFSDYVNLIKNFAGSTPMAVINTDSGPSSEAYFLVVSDGTSRGRFVKRSSTYPTVGIISASDLGILNENSGDIAIYNAVTTTGRIKFAAGGATTSQMTLFANGNLGINVGVTDGGEKFQVSGRAAVRHDITQGTFGSFTNRIGLFGAQTVDVPTTAAFNIGTVTAAGTSAQYLTFNGNTTVGGDSLLAGSVHINSVQFATTGAVTMNNSAAGGQRTLSVMQLQMQKAGIVGGTINRGSTLYLFGVYPTTSTGGTVTFTEYAGLRIGNLMEWLDGTPPNTTVALTNKWGIYQEGPADPNYFAGAVGVGITTPNPSAKLQVNSTTQGFLPPRMSTTQRNAIVTPAAGLIVYDTDLNIHYGYNGTTWNAFY